MLALVIGLWQKTAAGGKQHVILDRSREDGERRRKMMEVDFTNFHHVVDISRGFASPVSYWTTSSSQP